MEQRVSVLSRSRARVEILQNHLLPSTPRINLQPNQTIFQNFLTSSEFVEDYEIRGYRPGEDDSSFLKLDHLCTQGSRIKLKTEFLFPEPFETLQSNSWAVVAFDSKKDMVGISRSYNYRCYFNGQLRSLSYLFQLRVHPEHRGRNLAIWLIVQLYYHDHQIHDPEYFLTWVVSDNTSSHALQKRMFDLGRDREDIATPDHLEPYYSIGSLIDAFLALEKLPGTSTLKLKKVPLEEEIKVLHKVHSYRQMLLEDLEGLVHSRYSLGTYVLVDENDETLAGVSVWNSGLLKKSYLITGDNSKEFDANSAVLLYNGWASPSPTHPDPVKLLRELTQALGPLLKQLKFEFITTFYSVAEFDELNQLLASCAIVKVAWESRIWYPKAYIPPVDTVNYPGIFYDPRQCLM